jgi:CRISPR-associated exonuclease Cas4
MPEPEKIAAMNGNSDDVVGLSALNHYLYCERRCALIQVEGVFLENAFTVEGQLHHQEADTPGYESQPGARVVRALPVYSHRLGLSGRADIVEFRGKIPFPVEYKRGKRKRWDNDDVQLCAQALCLEEMFGVAVNKGAVFHASSRRRRDVVFSEAVRGLTLETIAKVRRMIAAQILPKAQLKPQCEGCSLRPICMPELRSGAFDRAARQLFQPES